MAIGNLSTVIEDAIYKHLKNVQTCTIAKVDKVNEDQTVDCTSLIREIDDQGNAWPPESMLEIPIVIMGSKETNMTVKVAEGDIGIVFAATSEVYTWNKEGREVTVTAGTNARTSYSNGIFMPISVTLDLENAGSIIGLTNRIVIKNDDNSLTLDITGDEGTGIQLIALLKDVLLQSAKSSLLLSDLITLKNDQSSLKKELETIYTTMSSLMDDVNTRVGAVETDIKTWANQLTTLPVAGMGAPLGAPPPTFTGQDIATDIDGPKGDLANIFGD